MSNLVIVAIGGNSLVQDLKKKKQVASSFLLSMQIFLNYESIRSVLFSSLKIFNANWI